MPEAPAIGLVYGDPQEERAAELEEEAGKYFSRLAQKVEAKLKACGFPAPPLSHGAQIGVICRSFLAWKKVYAALIQDPIGNAIYTARELFDLDLVSGDTATIHNLIDSP
jgi:signal-transduction protein with cAMP-binding, CBS, and nucleotidyltransferase domain